MSTFYIEPQSREILSRWLQGNGIQVHPALKIVDMDEGCGWMVEASARIPEGEICKLPTSLTMRCIHTPRQPTYRADSRVKADLSSAQRLKTLPPLAPHIIPLPIVTARPDSPAFLILLVSLYTGSDKSCHPGVCALYPA